MLYILVLVKLGIHIVCFTYDTVFEGCFAKNKTKHESALITVYILRICHVIFIFLLCFVWIPLIFRVRTTLCVNLKVRAHYVVRQNATKCGFAAQQMTRIMWTSMQRGLGRASACRGVKIQTAKCRSHQMFTILIFAINCSIDAIFSATYGDKGFQNCNSQSDKKSDEVHWWSFSVLVPQFL